MISRITNEDDKRKDIVNNCNSNCMIEAGAGAGKTTIIIDRIINQFKSGKLDASQLVVITFTKAAAGELRDRLSKKLVEALEQTTKEEEKNNLKEAIENQSLIQVSTIHSFCFRLLKERALDINLPLDVAMLEEYDNNARIDSFFKLWYRNQDKKEMLALNKEFYLRNYSTYVYECFKEICDLPDDMRFRYYHDLLKGKKLDDYVKEMKNQVKSLFDEMINILNDNGIVINSYNELQACNKLNKSASGLISAYHSNNKRYFIKKYSDVSVKHLFSEGNIFEGRSNVGKNMNASINAICVNYKNLAIPLNNYQNALVLKSALEARIAYNEELKKGENRHFVSNDQLLKMALELVKKEGALQHFQNEFKYIYVDEFQDTDTVQRDLVFTLAKGLNGKFNDSSFFLVGDPKQSIYAFRGADLEVYQDTKQELEKDYHDNVYVYELQRNYRSEGKIINWVNREFQSAEYGLGDLYLAMNNENKGKEDNKILNGVYTLREPKNQYKGKTKKKDLDNRESYFLVELIKVLMKDYKINKFIKDENGKIIDIIQRPIEYSDFLVLTKKKDSLEIYADNLKRNGMPVNLYGALDLENDAIILRFKAIIHYLCNQKDAKAKYGAQEVLMRSLINKENEDNANTALDELKESVKDLSACATIEYLTHQPKYFLDKYTNKEQMDYVQSILQQLLEYLLASGTCSLNEYDALIDLYIASGVDKSLSLTREENAIRLMNLHKSKGLEGKIVIVLARGQDQYDKDDSYRKIYDYYPTIKESPRGSRYAVYNSEIGGLLNEEVPKMARQDEYRRLEYVEATRAEEALIFFDNHGTKFTTIFDKFNYSDCVDLTLHDKIIGDLYQNIMVDGNIKDDEEKYNDVSKDLDIFNVNLNDDQKQISYTNSSPSQYENYDTEWNPSFEKRPMGATFGTILHRVFELTCLLIKDNKNIDNNEIISQAIMESYKELKEDSKDNSDIRLKQYQNYLNIKLDEFKNSSLMDKIIKAKEIYPEYKFNFFVTDDMKVDLLDSGTKWLNGKVDLILVFDDCIEIYDYKTDHKGNLSVEELNQHLEDTYSYQQKLYCYAVSKCFNVERDKVNYHFYHLYQQE